MPAFGTVSMQKRTVPKPGHGGVGLKKPTVVGFKNATSPAFRVNWHAMPIRVNKKLTL